MVALGGADAYYEYGIHAWGELKFLNQGILKLSCVLLKDYAAGEFIVREAGGNEIANCFFFARL